MNRRGLTPRRVDERRITRNTSFGSVGEMVIVSHSRSITCSAVALLLLSACTGLGSNQSNATSSELPGNKSPAGLRPHLAYSYVTSTPAPDALAHCPSGTNALGGGFENDNTNNTTASHPYNQGAAWRASAANGQDITAYVICTDGTAPVYETTDWTSNKGGIAECGSGHTLSGGGFNLSSSNGQVIFNEAGAYWEWDAQTYSLTSSGTAYGICDSGSPTKYTYVTSAASTDAIATCPSGDVVVGGGFSAAQPYESSGYGYVIRSHWYNNHKSWRVTSTAGNFTAEAVCGPSP